MTLTREQVLEMGAGREMNVLVADRVFGVKTPSLQWSPSSDIYDTWDVVEKLAKSGLGVEMYVNRVTNTVIMGQIMVHCDDSMPLAICRAALLTTIGEGTE